MSRGWRADIARQVDELGRWFRGRVVVSPLPSDELVPAGSLLNAARLRAAVARSVSINSRPAGASETELSIAASRLARHHSACLTAIALVGLSRGIGLDVSAANCVLVVRYNVPFCVSLREWRRLPADRRTVWRGLYAEHLAPLFDRLAEVARVSPVLLWTNAAEWVGIMAEASVEYLTAAAAEPIVAECKALLAARTLPGVPGDNPLRDKLDWVPGDGAGFPDRVLTRKVCCRTYLLDDRFGRLCQSCPYLPVPDRIALVRERHGVPMGAAGGAAEQQSVQRGLARPTARRTLARKQRDPG